MANVVVQGTDLEVVAYVASHGRLVIRVNKAGICVVDVGIANATAELTADQLMTIGALTQPVLRDLKKASAADLLKEIPEVPG